MKLRSRFERELELLNTELIEMGNAVEASIESAIEALLNLDTELAKNVIEQDIEIDQLEKDIESRCLRLLLQQQPVASDLRIISSTLKMITDMERIGDYSVDIADITLFLSETQYESKHGLLQGMGESAVKMVRESIDAFVKKDIETVKSVIEYDDVVDDYFNQSRTIAIDMIRRGGTEGEIALDLMMVARYLERIGDHAENIAEWVYYSIEGEHFVKEYKD
ncbi:MAG: phosphate signaling complex protein PhoU [Tissierellia bacterium]|nr:phosphate signaling complex protein PhoU [Tissierellia bacterium]